MPSTDEVVINARGFSATEYAIIAGAIGAIVYDWIIYGPAPISFIVIGALATPLVGALYLSSIITRCVLRDGDFVVIAGRIIYWKKTVPLSAISLLTITEPSLSGRIPNGPVFYPAMMRTDDQLSADLIIKCDCSEHSDGHLDIALRRPWIALIDDAVQLQQLFDRHNHTVQIDDEIGVLGRASQDVSSNGLNVNELARGVTVELGPVDVRFWSAHIATAAFLIVACLVLLPPSLVMHMHIAQLHDLARIGTGALISLGIILVLAAITEIIEMLRQFRSNVSRVTLYRDRIAFTGPASRKVQQNVYYEAIAGVRIVRSNPLFELSWGGGQYTPCCLSIMSYDGSHICIGKGRQHDALRRVQRLLLEAIEDHNSVEVC